MNGIRFVIISVIMAGCSKEDTITNSVMELEQSDIVFISRRIDDSSDWELYSMKADGSGQRRLTDKSVRYERVVCSPDGSRLGFTSYSNGEYELYILNLAENSLTLLAKGSRYCGMVAWSPINNELVLQEIVIIQQMKRIYFALILPEVNLKC